MCRMQSHSLTVLWCLWSLKFVWLGDTVKCMNASAVCLVGMSMRSPAKACNVHKAASTTVLWSGLLKQLGIACCYCGIATYVFPGGGLDGAPWLGSQPGAEAVPATIPPPAVVHTSEGCIYWDRAACNPTTCVSHNSADKGSTDTCCVKECSTQHCTLAAQGWHCQLAMAVQAQMSGCNWLGVQSFMPPPQLCMVDPSQLGMMPSAVLCVLGCASTPSGSQMIRAAGHRL